MKKAWRGGERGGGGGTHILHGRGRMDINPRISTMPGVMFWWLFIDVGVVGVGWG